MSRLLAFATRRPRLAEFLALGLPVLLFYAPVLAGVRTFVAGDFTQHFLPFSLLQNTSLRAGQLALWNPHTFGGHPFLADIQAAVYYPVSNLLHLLTLWATDPAARLYLLEVEAVLHTLLAGWFVGLLVRSLTGVRWAAVLGGLTYALSGYVVGYPPLQLAVLRTGIWLPLVLWLLLNAQRAVSSGKRPWGWALGAGSAIAVSFLAGHPQTFLHALYVTTAWGLLLLARTSALGVGAAVRFGVAGLLAAMTAVALSMAQILPSVEFTDISVRAVADYAFAAGGFPLRDTWQIVLPGILTVYSPLYVGLPALILTVVALATAARRQPIAKKLEHVPAATWFFAGLALFGILLSYGGNGPLFGLVYRLLPGFGAFRGQERAAYLVAVALSSLAGIGAARVNELSAQTRKRIALASGAVLIAAIYAAGLLLQLPGRTAVDNGTFLVTAILGLALTATSSLVLWFPHSEALGPRLVGLTLAGLFFASFGLNFSGASLTKQTTLPPEAVALSEAVATNPEVAQGLPGRVYNEFRIWEDYAMVAGVEDLWGASPLRLARYAALQEEFPLDRWWTLTGVTHVLTWRRELFVPSTLLGEWPQESDTTYLHRLEKPGPRAWLVSGVVVADDSHALELLADHTFPLTSTVVIAPESGAQEQPAAEPARPAEITLSRLRPDTLSVSVASDGGLLVLAENWMPGWVVERSGGASDDRRFGLAPYSLVRANLSFLGVTVPPGNVTFVLRYAPPSANTGLWVSGSALAAVLFAFFLLAITRRQWGQS